MKFADYDTLGNATSSLYDSLQFYKFTSPIFESQYITKQLVKIQKGGNWVDTTKSSIQWFNNNPIQSTWQVNKAGTWITTSRLTRRFDSNDYFLGYEIEGFYDPLNTLIVTSGYKNTPTYAFNNIDVMEATVMGYGVTYPSGIGFWQNQYKYVYSNHTQFTSLSSTSKIELLHLYPNPTTNSFKVEERSGSLSIRNAIGQTVYTQELDGQTITPNLRAGVYVVNVIEEGKAVKSSKLMVQ
jgi:hypothetical protein